MRNITEIVVHCSAEPHGRPTRAADIDRWHRQRGFDRIGYHYVIRVDGEVEPGRPEAVIGAHVAGHNATTIGVCMIGGLDKLTNKPSDAFADAQYDALERVLRDLTTRYPKARVLGHRDYPGVAKACPCFNVIPWWSSRTGKP